LFHGRRGRIERKNKRIHREKITRVVVREFNRAAQYYSEPMNKAKELDAFLTNIPVDCDGLGNIADLIIFTRRYARGG
jgi:hypothetical protein